MTLYHMPLLGGPASIRARLGAYQTAQLCGLMSGLKVCVDAGDSASYSGSGQLWTNLAASEPQFDFGLDGTVEAVDPSFVGTAGRRSSGEYMQFTYADNEVFTPNGTPDGSWSDAFHHDGATFTSICYGYYTSTGQNQRIWSDNFSGAECAFFYTANSNRSLQFDALNAGGSDAFSAGSALLVNDSAWNCMGLSGDEPNGNWNWLLNLAIETDTGVTYSSPGSLPSSGAFCLGRDATSGSLRGWGGRMAWVLIWTVALSAPALLAFNMSGRGKWSL